MNKQILNALMQLFATVGKVDGAGKLARAVVENYLRQQLNSKQASEYLEVYDEILLKEQASGDSEKQKKRLSASSVKIVVICTRISEELDQRQRLIVLIKLVEFIVSNKVISEVERAFLDVVYSTFNIPEKEFHNLLGFATANLDELEQNQDFLLISNHEIVGNKNRFLLSEGIRGKVGVLYFPVEGLLLVKPESGTELYINGQLPDAGLIILPQGSTLRGGKSDPVYYSDIIALFLNEQQSQKIAYEVLDVSYQFASGDMGVQSLTIRENSGKLIGIMGGSGAGKSTLLNILNGNLKPTTGKVLVNGVNIHDPKEKPEGMIGFVTQDDLLLEELTVYQNLYFNAKLCFGNLNEVEIAELVLKVLNQLGLAEIKDLQVGDVFNKVISGGQRKRLNIALELIREPMILFADEPTSGLSSRDSENVIDLLKELALKGKLVFVVIHQPSSDIYKLFDKLIVLDKGGYLAYYGNPLEAVTYFKKNVNHLKSDESECQTCGNVNPEQIFSILETKVLDEFGSPTKERKITPKEWNEKYRGKLMENNRQNFVSVDEKIQKSDSKPSAFVQFVTYFKRDILAKSANKQYIAINIAEPLFLAGILALILRKSTDSGYVFQENNNLPAYLFICVIVSLFLGLMLSSEEIFKDRKLLKREAFLSLNRNSYLLSKMLVLFLISALQTLIFVLVGNSILEIKGMNMSYWLILFSTSFFANMLGLNISAAFNSAVTIYIMIPLLIIPQILLSGILVKYHDLFPPLASQTVVPMVGEVMASRWAYEALTVYQFTSNKHQQKFYSLDKKINQAHYLRSTWYNTMQKMLNDWKEKPDEHAENLNIIQNELATYAPLFSLNVKAMVAELEMDNSPFSFSQINALLAAIKLENTEKYNQSLGLKDRYMAQINADPKLKLAYDATEKDYSNNSLSDFVRTANAGTTILEGKHLVKLSDPIYTEGPSYKWIRAHYFAPTKNLFGYQTQTFWVNVVVIWLMSVCLFLVLKFDLIKRLFGKWG